MIKVSVFYPNEEGKRFDFDYYANQHLALLHQKLDSLGLLRSEAEKGVSDADPSAPPRFVAAGALYFDTVEHVHEGFKTHGREIMGDIPNYTDIAPQFLISEIIG
jgi:uncharacterized protein (TIGR02118 family)